ncbi:hypothetical protein Tco_0549521 [Tanacetum coccineum]
MCMAILGYLTWRHSHSCVFIDLPIDGYNKDDVEWLCTRLIRLCEMKEEVRVRSGLSSVWSNRKCDHVFRRKDDNSGALIPLPTPDEVVAAQPDPRLARRSQGPSKGKARISSVVASEPNQPYKKRKLRKRV